jgi:prepilin-type N-terminal cleavage/methylation domain-containing protein
MLTQCKKQGRAGGRAGFSLVEVLVAVVLVGVAIAALLAANGAFTQVNGAGIDLSTAEFLIEQLRERTAMLPVIDADTGMTTFGPETGETTAAAYDDLDDFDNAPLCPPVDAEGMPLAEFASFTQQVTVENVSDASLDTVVGDHDSDFVRFTVTILQNNATISSASWIRARY